MPDSTIHMPSAVANDDDQHMSYATASAEDRCSPRQRLSIPARMRFSCSSSFPVEVTDMSLAGFACDALLLEAEVVQHSKNGMGCAFKKLLNLAVLNHYVGKYPPK